MPPLYPLLIDSSEDTISCGTEDPARVATISGKSPEFARWAVGIPRVSRHRDKGVFGSFLDKTSGGRKITQS